MQAHQSKTPACSSYIPLVRARQQHSSGSARRCIRSPAGPRMRMRAPARSCAEFRGLRRTLSSRTMQRRSTRMENQSMSETRSYI